MGFSLSTFLNSMVTLVIMVFIILASYHFINWIAETVSDMLTNASNNEEASKLLVLTLSIIYLVVAYIMTINNIYFFKVL